MEKKSSPLVTKEWLATYWAQNPRNEGEDPFQYNNRMMDQVLALLHSDQIKLFADYGGTGSLQEMKPQH